MNDTISDKFVITKFRITSIGGAKIKDPKWVDYRPVHLDNTPELDKIKGSKGKEDIFE